jgi:uncharacterized protein YndB with AHSA1/START domain
MKSLRPLLPLTIAVLGFACSSVASAGNVIQTAQFRGVTPQQIYDAYLSSKDHAGMTGMPATWFRPGTGKDVATGQVGDEFHGFGMTGRDGKFQYLIGGRLLDLVPGREIVMTWKATAWGPRAGTPDCILTLTFAKTPEGTEIRLVQVNVPDFADADDIKAASVDGAATETDHVNTNWYFRYWEPMQKFFAAQAKPAP